MKLVLNRLEVDRALGSMVHEIQKFDTRNLCIVPILKGGVRIAHRLLEMFSPSEQKNIIIGYMGLSSYHDEVETTGKVDLTYSLDVSEEELRGRDIWLIDDVYDSGLTMIDAQNRMKCSHSARSIKSAVLVRKMNPKIKLYKEEEDLPDVVGFEYKRQGFLVGMGMGHGEKYRCLDQIYELEGWEISGNV